MGVFLFQRQNAKRVLLYNQNYFMVKSMSRLLLMVCALALVSCASSKKNKTYTYQYNPGNTAILRNGYAIAPKNAPLAVKRAIEAGNRLQNKPYIYGGGHRSFNDRGYDCSGTTSYVLHHAGYLERPTTSGSFMKFGKSGRGKWITVYARRGHVFMEIAGLRLDTGYNGQGKGPRWSTRPRPTKGTVARHPPGL